MGRQSEERVSENKRKGIYLIIHIMLLYLQPQEHCLTQDKYSANIFLYGNIEGRREGNKLVSILMNDTV